jgi:general secretion pathway protein G
MNRGFTLIELVIVIAIISLITSIALPSFASIQNRAKESALRGVGHSIQVSLESYYMSKGTYPAGTAISVADLIPILATQGAFSQQPKNPFTGQPFASGDDSGKMEYTYDAATQTYSLTGYGLGNQTALFVLQNN